MPAAATDTAANQFRCPLCWSDTQHRHLLAGTWRGRSIIGVGLNRALRDEVHTIARTRNDASKACRNFRKAAGLSDMDVNTRGAFGEVGMREVFLAAGFPDALLTPVNPSGGSDGGVDLTVAGITFGIRTTDHGRNFLFAEDRPSVYRRPRLSLLAWSDYDTCVHLAGWCETKALEGMAEDGFGDMATGTRVVRFAQLAEYPNLLSRLHATRRARAAGLESTE